MSRRRTKLVVVDPCGTRGAYLTADVFKSLKAAAAFEIQFTLKYESKNVLNLVVWCLEHLGFVMVPSFVLKAIFCLF